MCPEPARHTGTWLERLGDTHSLVADVIQAHSVGLQGGVFDPIYSIRNRGMR